MNLNETSNERLINLYKDYKLKNDLLALTLTNFIEMGILLYAEFLKKNEIYYKSTDDFKEILLRPGRRPFREKIKEKKVNHNISLDYKIYEVFLNVTYSHVMEYDKINASNYSLSYMTLILESKNIYSFK